MPNTCLNNILSVVRTFDHDDLFACRCIIVGAGPSGLAVGAGLKKQGVPFIILERANCIASLWQNHTYDRLKLHLPKQFCQLPNFPFPEDFPEYPTKRQFITYLESYAKHFDISPHFNETVHSAKYDETSGLWRVKTIRETSSNSNLIGDDQVEYICQWLVVATGENAEKVVPEFEGFEEFGGHVIHVCDYKSGKRYCRKRVLVVGCGNSGMEVSLDLCSHEAEPSMVVRNSVHVLPREVMGKSTFELAVLLMKWLPLWLVDKILLILAWLILGNVEKYGLRRPSIGPLQLKNSAGKTPVLDIGALQKIRSGEIKVVPGVKRFFPGRVELVNGDDIEIDSVILATGYRSNVPSWLKENDFFSQDGIPKNPFPNGWKGKAGLYAVGFTRRGLSGASLDAISVAHDISKSWKEETKRRNKIIFLVICFFFLCSNFSTQTDLSLTYQSGNQGNKNRHTYKKKIILTTNKPKILKKCEMHLLWRAAVDFFLCFVSFQNVKIIGFLFLFFFFFLFCTKEDEAYCFSCSKDTCTSNRYYNFTI